MVVARFRIDGEDLILELTRGEKLFGLRGDVRVPLNAIRAVDVVNRPLTAAHGMRAPGLAVPGRVKIGTWRRRDGRSFVVLRAHQPAVRVALESAGFDELVISTDDAVRVAGEIRRAAHL